MSKERLSTQQKKAKILELAEKDSYTRKELCNLVEINRCTLYDWINNDKAFADALNAAETRFIDNITEDAKVSLRKMVQGYTAEETTVVSVPSKTKRDTSGNPLPEIKEQKTIRKHIPPNTGAIIFALTNGDPDHWQNKQAQDITAKVDAKVEDTKRYDIGDLSDEALQAIATALQKAEHEKTKQ